MIELSGRVLDLEIRYAREMTRIENELLVSLERIGRDAPADDHIHQELDISRIEANNRLAEIQHELEEAFRSHDETLHGSY